MFATACSSSGGSGGGSSSQSAGGGTTVSIVLKSNRLTAPDGHTLYYNTADNKSKIICTGECSSEWPPMSGTPKAGTGVQQADLGTTKRPDGSVQVTFKGHPLYEFSGDKAAGDTNGNGLTDEGGKWMVASPTQATGGSTGSAPTSSGGGGYTY
jgi:predicted lipoprotein with Yx(FWY)xxD motif